MFFILLLTGSSKQKRRHGLRLPRQLTLFSRSFSISRHYFHMQLSDSPPQPFTPTPRALRSSPPGTGRSNRPLAVPAAITGPALRPKSASPLRLPRKHRHLLTFFQRRRREREGGGRRPAPLSPRRRAGRRRGPRAPGAAAGPSPSDRGHRARAAALPSAGNRFRCVPAAPGPGRGGAGWLAAILAQTCAPLWPAWPRPKWRLPCVGAPLCE